MLLDKEKKLFLPSLNRCIMFWIIVFSIIFIGLLFILAEILFVPGGILGILGILVLLFGIYYGFSSGGNSKGAVVLGITFIITIGSIIYAVRNKTWRKVSLQTKISQKFNVNSGLSIIKGLEGKTITRLNPMGKARFADDTAEVISVEGFVDEGTPIFVHKIEGSKIYVKPKI